MGPRDEKVSTSKHEAVHSIPQCLSRKVSSLDQAAPCDGQYNTAQSVEQQIKQYNSKHHHNNGEQQKGGTGREKKFKGIHIPFQNLK